MPRSKKVEGDIEEAEIYSVSMTHQLHCLVYKSLSLWMHKLRRVIGSYKGRNNQVFQGR